ncbi:MAG: helicase RepA family protein [Pseudomonadota bacterium]
MGYAEFAALDLDDVRNPETGGLLPWAEALVEQSASYAEVTPSNKGIRILGHVSANFPSIGTRKQHPKGGSFEVYANLKEGQGRYITVSGNRLQDAPDVLANVDQIATELLELDERAGKKEAKTANDNLNTKLRKVTLSEIETTVAKLPSNLREKIEFGETRDRSADFQGIVNALHAHPGVDLPLTIAIFEYFPSGPAEKYVNDNRLEAEVKRSWEKAEQYSPRYSSGIDLQAAKTINPTPFAFRDPSSITPRAWLYGRHLISGFLSLTVSPGGVGKSSLAIVEALSMATGRNLLGDAAPRPLNVWYWNGEDPAEELERRVAAACIHYDITQSNLCGRLHVDSGRDQPIKMAFQDKSGVSIAQPLITELTEGLRRREIDALIVDPFVTTHSVSENDNGAINTVADVWRDIANNTGCAIELIHHSKKGSRQAAFEMGVDQARGASALVDAARSVRFLVRMTPEEAQRLGLHAHLGYFRVEDGKANLAPPADKAKWREITNVSLGNETIEHPEGDWVGVVSAWEMPNPLHELAPETIAKIKQAIDSGNWKQNEQAANWAGNAIAEAVEVYDIGPPKKSERSQQQNYARAEVRSILTGLIGRGELKVERKRDERNRKEAPFVVTDKSAQSPTDWDV